MRLYFKRQVRVRALVVNEKSEILLVRSWFSRQWWSLPGGGMKFGESPQVAAVREVFEETGVHIDERSCKKLGMFSSGDTRAPFSVSCHLVHIEKQPARITAKARLEMLDAAWFPLDSLPLQRSVTVDSALELLGQNAA